VAEVKKICNHGLLK